MVRSSIEARAHAASVARTRSNEGVLTLVANVLRGGVEGRWRKRQRTLSLRRNGTRNLAFQDARVGGSDDGAVRIEHLGGECHGRGGQSGDGKEAPHDGTSVEK